MASPLETIAFVAKNISSRVSLGTHTVTVNGTLSLDVVLTGLNGAAATLTVDAAVTRSANVYGGDRYSRAKRSVTSTREIMPALSQSVLSGDTVTIYATSTNASDTSVSGSVIVRNNSIDEIITGQPAQKYNGVRGPGVYLYTSGGVAGTTLGTNGTINNPVDTIADAITLCTALGANRIYLRNSTTAVLTGLVMSGFEIVGTNGPDSNTINLGTAASPSVLTRFAAFGCTVYGEHDLSDRIELVESIITDAPAAAVTRLHLLARDCILLDDFTLDTSNDNVFLNCRDGGAGGVYPTINATGAAGSLLIRDYRGGIGLAGLSSSHDLSLDGIGRVIYEASCNVNVEIILRGIWDEVDNTAGMANVTRSAVINRSAINAEADTAISDAALATAANLALAQTDLDTITDTGVTATNMRGTDGANTTTPNTIAPDNATITAIAVSIAALNDLSSAAAQAAATAALTAYDPATRTEATADKDEVLTAVAGVGGGGLTYDFNLAFTITDGTDPLTAAYVRIVNSGNATVSQGLTDASGLLTLTADAGAFTVLVTKAGHTGVSQALTVAADATVATIALTANTAPTVDASQSAGSARLVNGQGTALSTTAVRFRLKALSSAESDGLMVDDAEFTLTTDVDGYLSGTFLRGARYQCRVNSATQATNWVSFEVPDAASFSIPALVQ